MKFSYLLSCSLLLCGACGRTSLADFIGEPVEVARGGSDTGGNASGLAGNGGQSSSGGETGFGANGSGGSDTDESGGSDTDGSGGGVSPECDAQADCLSPDLCLVGNCEQGVGEYSQRDQDADGAVDALCGGSDCNDLNPLASPGKSENCTDGADNDCNGVADCFDPACRDTTSCGCTPRLSGELCNNAIDDDCDGTVDCNDADCVGISSCGCSAELCQNGADDDCDGRLDCEDPDCAATPACLCTATPEQCDNRVDEDCDGQIDCADPDCSFNAACLCLTPQPEQCVDGRDNDCDGLADCADPDCFSSTACADCSTEVCTGGLDEDCDGLVDCADPSCSFAEACPPAPEECNNQRDDDFDELADCNDPDCFNVPFCVEQQNTCATARRIEPLASAQYRGDTTGQLSNFRSSCGGDAGEALFRLQLQEPTRVSLDTIGSSFDSVLYVRRGNCAFGEEIGCDDDSGGFFFSSALEFDILQPGTYFIFVDGLSVDAIFGIAEGPYVLNVEVGPAVEDCNDSRDNDGDGFADCADSECANLGACVACNSGQPAVAEYGPALCTDGIDNDCDGVSDCDDEDCAASPESNAECCTGTDQNGNGIPDDFNCRCNTDSDCSAPGQLCYTSTIKACGIPCDRFVGNNICPTLMPGTTCNVATRQCEF